jgi:hypothetical protein
LGDGKVTVSAGYGIFGEAASSADSGGRDEIHARAAFVTEPARFVRNRTSNRCVGHAVRGNTLWRISMLESLSKIEPMPADARRNEPPPQPARESGRDARLATLLEQEQLWFSWLTVLHERLSKVKPNDGLATEGQKVLEIAKRRWLEAKEALAQYRASH